MNEFALIEQFFKSIPIKSKEVLFGIGDDAACLQIPPGNNLLVSTDTLVSGIHFLPEWGAYDIARRSVMVNISDMAAMGATPRWLTLALTLDKFDSHWLTEFTRGLTDSLNQYNLDLIGGDTTHGPLSISLTILGLAPDGLAIRRSGASPGDVILVSGQLGAAALALKLLNNQEVSLEDKRELMDKLLYPTPRTDLISILRQYASAAIDISDGLSADLNHICDASKVGACLIEKQIPVHPLLNKYSNAQSIDLALSGGDDYELCFTVPAGQVNALYNDLSKENLVCYPIGFIEETLGLRIKKLDNQLEHLVPKGYSHF